MKMPFGRYKDQEIEDVPTGYLMWALENMDGLSYQVQEEMQNQLNAREGKGIVRKNE